MKVYSAKDLYAMTPESVNLELGELKGFYADHLPEIEQSCLWGLDNKRVELRVIKDFDFDGRRCWTLQTVWFDNKPVMIIQNAGRDVDDHRERFITNKGLFEDMVAYIKSLIETEMYYEDNLIDEEEPLERLTSFYGNTLDGVFERY